jgi:hypothetical protein
MAGAPKRRARKLAEAGIDPVPQFTPLQSVAIPEAIITPSPEGVNGTRPPGEATWQRPPGEATSPPRPSNVHSMPFPRVPPRRASSAPIGTETRRIGDSQYADALTQLAYVLRPDNIVTIERLQPSWCVGYLEDFVLSPEFAGVNELRAYLRDTYGGKVFRVTVLYPNGQPAWESRINVDAPPRYEGRLIYRDTWNGDRAPETRAPAHVERQAPQPQQSNASVFSDLKDVLSFAVSFATEGSRDRDNKMVEMMKESRESTRELVKALLERDTATAKAGSFREQLGEFVQASQALDEVKNQLAPDAGQGAQTEESIVDGAMREAMKGYIGNAIGAFTQKGGMGPIVRSHARARAPARGPQNGMNRPQNQAIPDAVVTGQPRRR